MKNDDIPELITREAVAEMIGYKLGGAVTKWIKSKDIKPTGRLGNMQLFFKSDIENSIDDFGELIEVKKYIKELQKTLARLTK